MPSPETHNTPEHHFARPESAEKKRQNTVETRPEAAEKSELSQEAARVVAQEALAKAKHEALPGQESPEPEHHKRSHELITPQSREVAFDQTMLSVRKDLGPMQRNFSKFIHSPKIEKMSDIAGGTIARPLPILFGAIFAFAGVLGLYAFAKQQGFSLSGSETIVIFAIGWIVGLVVDLARTIQRKRQR